MYYSPTNQDIGLIRQTEKTVFVNIELLDKQFKILDTLQGNLLSDTLNVDSKSKQRRTYSCELHVTDPSLLIGNDKKIWIDKYIRVYYGIKGGPGKSIAWWLVGTFTYIDVDYSYNAAENTLSLSCADLMADFDGTKNGQISGLNFVIPAGEGIRSSVLALLKEMGVSQYNVEDIQKEVPYDLEFSTPTTYCDILTQLCELYPSWEFFFDVDGTFIWRKIPSGLWEPVILDDSLIDCLWIDETTSHTFSEIYNVTEVWGKTLDLELEDRYAESSSYSDGVYHIALDDVASLEDIDHLDRIGIHICGSNGPGARVSINNLPPIPIVNDDGTPIAENRMAADTTYVFSYRRNMGDQVQNCLYLLGQYQAYGIYKETRPDCPFSVPNLGYEIVNSVTYDNLYSDDLCYNQAEYLTYQTTAMVDTISLKLILIPWLDVNQKIQYTSKMTGEKNQYMIQSFQWSSFEGTMTMTLCRLIKSFSEHTARFI